MPTTIDEQNALQIRQPMDIKVTLEAYDSNTSISFSEYSSSGIKIANYSTLNANYPMRVLADLQGEGFPLDNSCVLYNPNVQDSTANGKTGIRGDINQSFYFRFTLTQQTRMLTVNVNNGYRVYSVRGSAPVENGRAIIDVSGLTSSWIQVVPIMNQNLRAEVSSVTPGFFFEFDNEDILNINLNLRSDLTSVDPSLPESEIEVQAYYPDDISQALAEVHDGKPITYQAGYGSDLSTVRSFYISEQPTWQEHVLTFKGTDLISKFDKESFPFFIGRIDTGQYIAQNGAFRKLYSAFADQVWMAGINLVNYEEPPAASVDGTPTGTGAQSGDNMQNSVVKRQTQRDIVANFMNLMRFDDLNSGAYTDYDIDAFWPTYVDAGIPSLTWTKPTVKWHIYEQDCGDITFGTERKIASITIPNDTVMSRGFRQVSMDGSGTAFKNSGVGFEYTEYSTYQAFEYIGETRMETFYMTDYDEILDLPLDAQYGTAGRHPYLNSYIYGDALYDSQATKNKELNIRYSPFASWANWTEDNTISWNNLVNLGDIDSQATNISLTARGRGLYLNDHTYTGSQSVSGIDVVASKTSWHGVIRAKSKARNNTIQLLPGRGITNLLQRSNETGTFTWKGDPRMQPRDFFMFHRLNGTSYTCTIESIALKHEKGGTVAEISYRRGTI